MTLVSGNKWDALRLVFVSREQVIAYNKCPGIVILWGLVCPFPFVLPPLESGEICLIFSLVLELYIDTEASEKIKSHSWKLESPYPWQEETKLL